MNLKILIPILAGSITLVVFSIILLSFESQPNPSPESISEIDFAYSDFDKIQKILAIQNISMSSPTEITDHTVDQYCTFFDDENIQQFVKYCATTALVGFDDQHFGNVNMGGSPSEPIMALATIETSSFSDSKGNQIDFIFQTLIETLVCDCWQEKQPGGFESVQAWLDAAEGYYVGSGKTTLKSTINGLAQKQLILEITATDKYYIWTLIISKAV